MEDILLFASDAFRVLRDPQDPPSGQDIAEFLSERLVADDLGAGPPVEGTDGWEFVVGMGNDKYIVFVHWVPIGSPSEDYWVVQIRRSQGILATLLKRTPAGQLPQQLRDCVYRAFAADEHVRELRWLSSEEFANLY